MAPAINFDVGDIDWLEIALRAYVPTNRQAQANGAAPI